MRKIVLQMMTTLDGRLDDPMAWVNSVTDDLYQEIDRLYATFDTVLVGRVTHGEMAAYWPGAATETGGSSTNKTMAGRMNAYRKVVVSQSDNEPLSTWSNSERLIARSDSELDHALKNLKAQAGGDIHLAGGARFAQAVTQLGLVDEYRFFVHPVVSKGEAWFTKIVERYDLELLSASAFKNGVVGLYYRPKTVGESHRRDSFSDLIAS